MKNKPGKECIDCKKAVHYKVRCWECYCKTRFGSGNAMWNGGGPRCIDCNKQTAARSSKVKRCSDCRKKWYRGSNRKDWKERIISKQNGYAFVHTENGLALEHRHVMEQSLGRKLSSKEIVHHLNGIRDDNRLENLTVTTPQKHEHGTLAKHLQARIRELEKKPGAL